MSHADRNLLFGILAVQMHFVERDALIAAMHAWVLEQSKPLGRILVEQQALTPARRSLLEQLVDEHLAAHDGDADKSLAAVWGVWPIRGDLQDVADPDLHATLDRIAADRGTTAPDSEATMTYGVAAAATTGSRFCVLRPHAKGGLGQISVAVDSELNREVALKELRPERADDPVSRTRFLLEAEITGRLEHPGVVPVYGLGCDPRGRPFYAMRFVKGDTLKEAIDRFHASEGTTVTDPRRWNLALRQLVNKFVVVCDVMAYAHSRGVIHRDLKPANILLGPYGETLVVDWGLAKVVGRAEAAAESAAVELPLQSGSGSSETLPGTALGTPAYMSPEQSEGRLQHVGPLSDLYSLGATLYCLLTGKPPTDEADVGAALRRVQRGEFTPPRAVNFRVPRALEAIAKAMALKPEERYASPRALADDLERWLADEPVAVYREPWATRMTRWGRRHRTLATSIGALLVTAVLALAISTGLISREHAATERQRARAVQAAESLRREDYIHRINLADRELAVDNLRRALELLGDCPTDLRDWEWDYLKRLCRAEPMVIRTTAEVHGIAFRPDGAQIAAASEDGTVKVLDSRTGRLVQTLPAHRAAVFGVAFSPDGRHLALASEDRTIRLCDLSSGQDVFTRDGQVGESQGLAYSVAFSPDGRHLVAGSEVTGSEVGLAIVWNVADGSEVCRLPGHEKAAECVAFSPDRRLVATGSWAGVLRIWDAQMGQLLRTVPAHGQDRISAVAFHPDGRRLATASFDRTVKVWDATTGELLKTLRGHAGFISGLAFSRDGRRLASIGGEDKTVKIWDPLTAREILSLRGHTDTCTCVAFSPDGRRLVSASNDRTIRIWDATSLTGNEGLETLTCEHDDEVASVAFSPDGGFLASSSWNKTVWLRDAHTGALLRTHQNPGRVFHVAFSPDGRQLAAAGVSPGRTAFVKVWDTATGTEVGPAIRENSMPFSVTFDPDGRYLLNEGPGHTVKVWDARSRIPLGEIGRHDHQIWSMKFSPDGRRLATASVDGTVRVWAWDPARLGEMQNPQLTLSARVIGFGDRVAFSPDGLRLATGGEEHTIKVWDAQTGQHEQTLRGHTGDVFALAFDPHARWLASAGEDTTVRLWDTTSSPWELRHTLRGHTGFVMSLAFSPDGGRLVSGSRDRTLKVWDLARLVPRR